MAVSVKQWRGVSDQFFPAQWYKEAEAYSELLATNSRRAAGRERESLEGT
jgi:hypothetical protein